MNIKIENNKIQIADISALVNRTLYVVPESKDSVFFNYHSKPDLTQEQKTKLTNAGWTLQ